MSSTWLSSEIESISYAIENFARIEEEFGDEAVYADLYAGLYCSRKPVVA